MTNIFDMLGDTTPESQAKGAKTIFHGNEKFIIPPEDMNKKQKLSYIEYFYSINGPKAKADWILKEISVARGISRETFNKCVDYGVYIFEKRNK